MQYSAKTNAFYTKSIHGDAMPSDTVNVSSDDYIALLEGQSLGKKISSNVDGYPLLVDMPPPTLAQAQAAQIGLIEAAYQSAIQADINYLGATFNADNSTQLLIVKVLSAGQVPDGFFWQDVSNNQIPMTYAQLQGFSAAILDRGQQAFVKLQTLKSEIRAALDINAIQQIIW